MTEAAVYLPHFERMIQSSMKELFETKHLYQSVRYNLDSIREHAPEGWREPARTRIWHSFKMIAKGEWLVKNPFGRQLQLNTEEIFVMLEFPSVKLNCSICDRIEAYNFIGGTSTDYITASGEAQNSETIQQFAVTYQCQSCKDHPEVFLVRREGCKVTLCGRSPIEIIETPKHIPHSVQEYYTSAIISRNSGFTLAGIFYLRTLIEQWIYSLDPSQNKIDEAIEWYMASLPPDFKSRFKSIKELYGELSADIHSAEGSKELFVQAISDIEAHFDARRVFKL